MCITGCTIDPLRLTLQWENAHACTFRTLAHTEKRRKPSGCMLVSDPDVHAPAHICGCLLLFVSSSVLPRQERKDQR